MKNNLLLLTFLFSTAIVRAQTFCVNVDSIFQQQLILPYRIVIGEMHQVAGTYKAYEKIIRSLDLEKHYKLVIERSISFSCLINEYLSGSDTTLIEGITFHNDEEKAFYKTLYSLNKTLEPSQKILTIGIDLEYQLNYAHTLSALQYYLPKTLSPPSSIRIKTIVEDATITNIKKVESLLACIDTSILAGNKYDSIIESIGRNAQNTITISNASSLTWGRKREYFLLENYLNRVSGTTNFMLIIGVAHLPDNTHYPSFTKQLAKDPEQLQYYYPIYFNHSSTKYIKQGYYCEHHKDPLKKEPALFRYFDKQKGAWLMKKDKDNYLIISN